MSEEFYTAGFWTRNVKSVPGRPKSKSIYKPSDKSINSFRDFEASINDAWDLKEDDPIIDCANISKTISNEAALNVLNNHRNSRHLKITLEKSIDKPSSNRIPGKSRQINCSNPPQEEDSELKFKKFEKLFINLNSLQELSNLSWSGIPFKLRGVAWRLLAGYLPINSERRHNACEQKRRDYWGLVSNYYYAEYDESTRKLQHQISIDVPRMNPTVPLFHQKTVQTMLERILFIWSIRHPATGYVQGMNDLVTPFYVVFLTEFISEGEAFETYNVNNLSQDQLRIIEADSYWCLSKFLDGIQDNYVFTQVAIQRNIFLLEELIKRVDETLHRHLKQHNISYLQFSFRWFNNLLTRELPLRCIIRLWDTFLAEVDTLSSFQLYICAAFLLVWEKQLKNENDFQGLFLLLQNLPTQLWTSSEINVLVAEAYKLKFMFADAPNHFVRNSIC